MVDKELRGHCHTADTGTFLDSILPIPHETIEKVFQQLANNGTYASSSWANLPKNETKEDGLYGPFVNVVNAINKACGEATGGVKNYWVDRHSTSPRSRDKDAASIRPDVVSVLWDTKALESLEKEMTNLKTSIEEKGLVTDAQSEEFHVKTKELEKRLDIWWLRVHVPVEIKTGREDKDILGAVSQLCGYLRQVLREQMDRRFALGLVFCGTLLSVWLCDRSGLLGTMRSIDIHKEPKKFIHVIASLSLLEPERLGWDPTMRLYFPLRNEPFQFVHSYDPSIQIKDYRDTTYKTFWAIDMPSQDGQSRDTFITVRALSVVRAEVMCGRGTVVWQVVKHRDESKLYVLKQCWRPLEKKAEGSFYQTAKAKSDSPLIPKIYSFEEVKIGGFVDDTLASIRRGVTHTPLSLDPLNHSDRKRPRNEETEAFLHIKDTASDTKDFIAGNNVKPPRARVFSRLVMETYGWPIKYFKDIPELLRVIRDVIQGHRHLYYKGILHRDISSGNILICPNGVDVEKTSGCLIDLDYAKQTNNFIDPKPFTDSTHQDQRSKRTRQSVSFLVEEFHSAGVDEDAISALLSQYKDSGVAISYARHVCKSNPSLADTNQPLTCKDLGLFLQTDACPDFSDNIAGPAERTGTLPFMSYEVLFGSPYAGSTRDEVIHDSIHDMESVMWVVIYLCLTRKGPGGVRRDELGPNASRENVDVKALHAIVYCFFDSDDENDLAKNKAAFFRRPDHMETIVMTRFSPYFDSLKPIVSEWWQILQRCYRFSEWSTIHDQFLAVINGAIATLDPNGPVSTPPDDRTAEVLKRRKQDLCHELKFDVSTLNFATWSTSPDKVTTSANGYIPGAVVTGEPPGTPSPMPPKKKKRGGI